MEYSKAMTQKQLFARYAQDLKPGRLEWIGLRPARKQAMQVVDAAQALAGLGLEGDHRCCKTPGSARQVTLISSEFIDLIEIYTGIKQIDPSSLRRNLVISGINLNALRHQLFSIGGAVFEATALCHPCVRMDQALGKGGAASMLGYGGLCARILRSGRLQLGDPLIPLGVEAGALS
ncbi:MOSC domain-containing protein [Amphritea sp. 1_MG-2023]|uniref:MOSC domain-containing protein n=1 Tax=Amphritea sp. 1_MG-2023 TaxID=3062670 RepID=UPI0026E291A9|nr:MOSC domain-containing protein [Amphritea sp. 1_MG-2023]MDO6562258.1 MOSC domain-containing protein [Amphritea sp. 1_MG-2023]